MLIENSKCSACYLCVNICPRNCIQMKKDSSGEIHPVIDLKKCIGCNKCRMNCPEKNPLEKNSVRKTYAAIAKDREQLEKSTSGGVATEISKYIISQKGVVYSTVMDGLTAHFARIVASDDLDRITGSKYVHSHLEDNLKKIKEDLATGVAVLVIGMPCHIAAVRAYLVKEYSNLFTVDLFCHGTPSQENFRCGMSIETNEDKVIKVQFRNGKEYKLTIFKEDGSKLYVPYRRSYWFNGFVEGYLFRECCYECSYADDMRVGDISLGDFWGLGSCYKTDLDIRNGVNAVLVNTCQGEKIFACVSNKLNVEEHVLDEVKKYNHPLNAPANKPKEYKKYKNLSEKYGNKIAIILAFPKKSLFILVRRCIGKIDPLYGLLKKVPFFSNRI